MAKVAMVALELADQDCEVILGGGVLVARDPLLLADITAGLRWICPAVRIVVLDEPPIVGAALLGIAALAGAPDWQPPPDEAVVRRAVAKAVSSGSRRTGPA